MKTCICCGTERSKREKLIIAAVIAGGIALLVAIAVSYGRDIQKEREATDRGYKKAAETQAETFNRRCN